MLCKADCLQGSVGRHDIGANAFIFKNFFVRDHYSSFLYVYSKPFYSIILIIQENTSVFNTFLTKKISLLLLCFFSRWQFFLFVNNLLKNEKIRVKVIAIDY